MNTTVVAEHADLAEVLYGLLRGGAGQHAELILVFPLPPQPLVFLPGGQPGGGGVEDKGRVGGEAVEVGGGVVPSERLDQLPGGGEDLVGGAHGVAFLAARADRSS